MAAANSQESIVELARDLFSYVSNFISTKKIDGEKVGKYEKILKMLEERRDYWALNDELSPIDSIKIYGAYSTVYGTLCGVAYKLDLGIRRRENPKAAKEVYSVLSSAVELIPKLEMIHGDKRAPSQLISDIFQSSRSLRKQAISNQLIQAGETANGQELIKGLRAEIEAQLA